MILLASVMVGCKPQSAALCSGKSGALPYTAMPGRIQSDLAASAGLWRRLPALAARSDWIRPGIAVYGSAPDFPEHIAADWGLQPTMTLASKIIGTQDLEAGDSVGYGSAYTASQPMRIGVVACGYADGYPRHCPTGTPVLVGGVRCSLVGRVSMDMVTVDLTPVPHAGIGSDVTLWGTSSSGSQLPIDEVARAAGTVGYELMCALAQRVPTLVT